ncbi:MAG: hypothetical protein LBN07_00390 [Christensenellaceae bacterium]|jgi:hypothetical protein|nr:hypothetical protein [Christensenellaceae bacterium]
MKTQNKILVKNVKELENAIETAMLEEIKESGFWLDEGYSSESILQYLNDYIEIDEEIDEDLYYELQDEMFSTYDNNRSKIADKHKLKKLTDGSGEGTDIYYYKTIEGRRVAQAIIRYNKQLAKELKTR